MEVWKQIAEIPEYEVSSLGNIRKVGRTFNASLTALNREGYVLKTFRIDGKIKTFSIHRLVAKAFLPNPKSKIEVNHKDFNRANNSVSNLEWVTKSENIIHFLNRVHSEKRERKKYEASKGYKKKFFCF